MTRSYTSILVHVEDVPECRARLHLAADLANRFGAALIGRAAAQIQPPMSDPAGYVDASIVELERQDVERELTQAATLFKEISASARHGSEWRAGVAVPELAVAADARAADLIVVGRHPDLLDRGVYRAINPGDLVMEAGRPMLVVPPGTQDIHATRVLVAWKDARESRRAVFDALPFLRRAQEVIVSAVREAEDGSDAQHAAEDAAAYIRRHGANVRTDCSPARENTVGDEILLRAEQAGADLIVAGAYGHSRLREWVFGGVTRTLLARSPKVCLLSH